MFMSRAEIEVEIAKHKYQLVKPIGEGRFGKVYLIKSMKYNTEFVLKQIPIRDSASGQDREIDMLQSLIHPNIINIYEYWTDERSIYIIIEYCGKGSMWDMIENEGPIPKQTLVVYCKQLLAAMDYFHSLGITHNDIKPANILIDAYNRPKYADFGMGIRSDKDGLIKKIQGTPICMAPEMIRLEPYNPFQTDIWALGITFYMMATGKHPWGSNNITEVKKAIMNGAIIYPKELNKQFIDLLKLMLAEKPSMRALPRDLLGHPFFAPEKVERRINRNSSMIRLMKEASITNLLTFKKRVHKTTTATVMVPLSFMDKPVA